MIILQIIAVLILVISLINRGVDIGNFTMPRWLKIILFSYAATFLLVTSLPITGIELILVMLLNLAGFATGYATYGITISGTKYGHGEMLALLDDRPNTNTVWLSGIISGIQLTLIASITCIYYSMYVPAFLFLLAGALKPVAYYIASKIVTKTNPDPMANILNAIFVVLPFISLLVL